jgi:tetratricopeptide (TPR) repeat protein
LVTEGDFTGAERAYLNALAWDPDYQPALDKMKEINPELEKMRHQERAGLRNSMEIELILEKAQEFAADSNYLGAIKELDKALIIEPQHTRALALKNRYSIQHETIANELKLSAYSHYRQKEYTKAYRDYQKLLEIEPENHVARGRLTEISNKLQAALHLKEGLHLYEKGNYSLSAAEFQRALDFDPKDESSREYLAMSKNKLTGTTTLEELKQNPEMWQLYLDGIKAYQEGDFAGAIAKWEQVLYHYPNNPNTIRNIEQAKRLSELGGER